MIRELVLNKEAIIKSIDKESIVKKIVSALEKFEVMFIYLGGSIAYGTFISGVSDYDINVFVDGINGAFKIDIYGIDVFCYGKEVMIERLNPNNNLSQYKKCFIDDKLSLPDTLIYLNRKYQKEYEEYKNFNFNKVLRGFLTNFYEYFGFCFNGSSSLGKKFYHVIRIIGQLENYLNSGEFSLDLSKFYFNQTMDFKLHYDDLDKRNYYFELIEKYLNEIYEIKEGLKDG